MQQKTVTAAVEQPQFMPFHGWLPLPALWETPGGFPSEQSARWAIRIYRAELTKAGALVHYRRRMYFEPAKFKETLERIELAKQAQRVSPKCA